MRAAYGAGVAQSQDELMQGFVDVFRRILEDFDKMFLVEELPSPERDNLRKAIGKFVKHSRKELERPIKYDLNRAVTESTS